MCHNMYKAIFIQVKCSLSHFQFLSCNLSHYILHWFSLFLILLDSVASLIKTNHTIHKKFWKEYITTDSSSSSSIYMVSPVRTVCYLMYLFIRRVVKLTSSCCGLSLLSTLYKILSIICLSRWTSDSMKLLGIISMDFDARHQLLIGVSALNI